MSNQEFKNAAEHFEDALIAMVQVSQKDALAIVTGSFVGLTLELLRRQGHTPDGDIRIDGGEQRDVTIHAPKGKQ